MTEKQLASKVSVALATAAVMVGLVGAGYLVGKHRANRELRSFITIYRASETLGGVVRDNRAGMALAYDDVELARREMDGYAWSIENMPSPYVGAAPSPGQHVGAFINENQMRHPVPLEFPKPDGVFRIFLTGGSTAFGVGAPNDDSTITAFLQQIIDRELAPQRFEVINAANPAWTSTHERILIENRLSEMEPDLVVSFSGNNEAHFGFLGLHVLWFRTYAEHHFTLILSRFFEQLGFGDFPIPWNPSSSESVPADEVTRRLTKNLRLASAALEETGAPYVFALQPTLATTAKALSEEERSHLEAEQLGEGCADYFVGVYQSYAERLPELDFEGFHFVDVSTVFDDMSANETVFLDSYHFGDRGNRMIAERLFELLTPFLRD